MWVFVVMFAALALMITIKNSGRCKQEPLPARSMCLTAIEPGPDDSEYCCSIDYQIGNCISHLRVWAPSDFIEIRRGCSKRTFAAKSDQIPSMNLFLEELGCCKRFKFIGTTLVGYLETNTPLPRRANQILFKGERR